MPSVTEGIRVLFVCTANVCRSPFAERLTAVLTGGILDASSAGMWGADGLPMDDPMAAELALRGGDPDGFRSRRLRPAMLEAADLVLTMGAEHRRFILVDNPHLAGKVFTLGQFSRAVDTAPTGMHARPLLAHVASHRRSADPADDVTDPYRRGRRAAAACAEQITELLETALTGLLGRPYNQRS